MLIDNAYYIPDELYEAVAANADRLKKVQCVGMTYSAKAKPGFFADLRIGRLCSWVFGPEHTELRREKDLAVMLWIAPEGHYAF